jgi:hypothetical protein
MPNKYKVEKWKLKKWKGQKRQIETTIEKLVLRDTHGHFVKSKPIIETIQIKNYGSGVYRIGKDKTGKIRVRQKIAENSDSWFANRKEVTKNRKIYRASCVLNNIPISVSSPYYKYADKSSKQSWTIGFRINAFSHSQKLLISLKSKLKDRLKKWVEECLKYSASEFWFDSYYGHESPQLINCSKSENNKYYLTLENMKGHIIKQDSGTLTELR